MKKRESEKVTGEKPLWFGLINATFRLVLYLTYWSVSMKTCAVVLVNDDAPVNYYKH